MASTSAPVPSTSQALASRPIHRTARAAPASRTARGRHAVSGLVVCSAVATAELLGRELASDEAESWQSAVEALSDSLGLTEDEASRLLARAFGWTTQAFWRREKVEELPTPSQVQGVLEFLMDDLELGPEEQLKVVKAFPELLACDTESRLRANTAQLQKQWRLEGAALSKAVLRQPQVLGYSVDCGGDCIGECNRCWVRF
ncbi:hypothetical protein HYH03_006358 [Edaphochlamys debaryana]|uniref:Uncharacterized protein n=1 Tax=Edaphochlamys debaryana TaxID=47281 RepID=A0A835YAN1_9CHLO|nr:hypothetical protein HYH03_006358 [Edaphochlamys debaryana]|eukprot:KAG2495410.1 hypothetical protein HYH03_006358 [Edaphochlamys debaryana]